MKIMNLRYKISHLEKMEIFENQTGKNIILCYIIFNLFIM